MVNIFGKNYTIDIDEATKKCQTDAIIKNDDGTEDVGINLFKYEILKVCLERVLNEYENADEELGILGEKEFPISFRIAFNTLIKYGVLIEDDNE